MGEGNKHFNVLIYLSDFRGNELNLMSTNINSTTIIKILNSNLKSNMKDINKTLANEHFKCKYKENNAKKQHIFVETYLSKDHLWKHISLRISEVYLSCLHCSLQFSEGEVVSLYLGSVVSPGKLFNLFL